jgi:PAS domain S-box-containing protein
MSNKPTYDELQQQVKELHNEALLLKKEKKKLEKKVNLSNIILSANPDLIVLKDNDLVYQAINPAFCMFLGKTEGNIIGKTDFDLFPRVEAERYRQDDLKVIETGKPIIQDEEVSGRKEKRWLRVAKTPVFSEKGANTGVLCSVVDITERKMTRKLLRESEERYRSLAENSRVGFWQTSSDGETIYINPAMCRILEVEEPEEIYGMTYDSFYDKNFLDKKNWKIIKGELAKRERGLSSTYEVELTGKKGTKRSVMISGAPIFLSGDKIHGSVATFIDITDKKKAEKALKKAHDELEKRVKERTRELEIKTRNLEETNIAMKVLLKKREEDRKDVEYNILTNVRKLIDPYFDKIRKTKLNSQQNAFLNIMESNLQEITSQFARKISMRDLNLTPTEIQVANMIRNGNSSKEIAGIMNISIRTVDAHRRNIRKKLGLDQKRANLRSYLLSLH